MKVSAKRAAALVIVAVLLGVAATASLNLLVGAPSGGSGTGGGDQRYTEIPGNAGPLKAIFPPYLFLPELSLRFPIFVERVDGNPLNITESDITVLLQDSAGRIIELQVLSVEVVGESIAQVWVKITGGFYTPGEATIGVVVEGLGSYRDSIPIVGPSPIGVLSGGELVVSTSGGTISLDMGGDHETMGYGVLVTCGGLPKAPVIEESHANIVVRLPGGCGEGVHTLMLPVDGGATAVYVEVTYKD